MPYVAGSSRPVGTPTRRYAPGRACALEGCPTILSTYNRGPMCDAHAEPRRYQVRGRRVEPGLEPVSRQIEARLADQPACLGGAHGPR